MAPFCVFLCVSEDWLNPGLDKLSKHSATELTSPSPWLNSIHVTLVCLPMHTGQPGNVWLIVKYSWLKMLTGKARCFTLPGLHIYHLHIQGHAKSQHFSLDAGTLRLVWNSSTGLPEYKCILVLIMVLDLHQSLKLTSSWHPGPWTSQLLVGPQLIYIRI